MTDERQQCEHRFTKPHHVFFGDAVAFECPGPAVTPEDPQRRELPAELIQSVAAAVHRATCLTGCTDEPSERHVLIAATAIEAAVAAGLLDHLLTSQGYEQRTEYWNSWHRDSLGVPESRTVWVSPWTLIGGEQS
jgi:hypothetical protein